MRTYGLWFGLVAVLAIITVSGCGGTPQNTVVEPTVEGGLAPEAQQSYEEAMKSRDGREGN